MSLPLCKFFSLNQTCRFGKHCRYSHSSQRPPPAPGIHSEIANHDEELLSRNQFLESAVNDPSTSLNFSKDEQHKDGEAVSVRQEGSVQLSKPFSTRQPRTPRQTVICNFFANGYCRYGRSCRFSHDVQRVPRAKQDGPLDRGQKQPCQELPPRFKKKSVEYDNDIPHSEVDRCAEKENFEQPEASPTAEPLRPIHRGKRGDESRQAERTGVKRVCPFYRSNRCNRGQRCRFLHPADLLSNESILEEELQNGVLKVYQAVSNNQARCADSSIQRNGSFDLVSKQPHPRAAAVRPVATRLIFTYEELQEVGIAQLRENDINYIKRRFPKDKISIEEGDTFSAVVSFSSSDPDWPFDIKSFPLSVTLPTDYPKSLPTVTVVAEQDVPETVRRYLEVTIGEWLEQKRKQLESVRKVELVFRAFLRWLDRNLEEIITQALTQLKRELTARAAGLEFIPAQKLQARFNTKAESSEDLEVESKSDSDDGEDSSDEEEDSGEEDSTSDEDEAGEGQRLRDLDLDPQKKGTEIALRHLQLKEKATALTFQRLKLVIQCDRCKTHADLVALPGKVMSLQCVKCTQHQYVNFRPALVHQFSSVCGYLDVDGCQAFDLILQDCQAVVSCMACSKQTSMSGLVSGQLVDGWCKACNARFKVALESVKFSQLVPSGIDTSVHKVVEVPSAKNKRAPKDPRIREGYPLPEFGTCKHYKHSYRWLRFPCCGKAYPCDVCHDKKEDHEMEMANRMICGHCCKEQNFSASRPCQSCKQHLTKVRSAHWEGGAGCRDKIAMSKNDAQKYSSMNKTISNHKKKVQAGSKGASKKKTKLRHA